MGLARKMLKNSLPSRNPFVFQVCFDKLFPNFNEFTEVQRSQSLRISGLFRCVGQRHPRKRITIVAIPSYFRSVSIRVLGIKNAKTADESQSLRISGLFRFKNARTASELYDAMSQSLRISGLFRFSWGWMIPNIRVRESQSLRISGLFR